MPALSYFVGCSLLFFVPAFLYCASICLYVFDRVIFIGAALGFSLLGAYLCFFI